jgi:aryl-alcohol dehydrogenase-like predicted oxidoreductase
MSIPKRAFGNKGFEVSILGLGAGQIGDPRLPDSTAEHLLNHALDKGITLFDTARAYGKSEERIGKYLNHRRDEFIISTKVGYGIKGYNDWSYESIIAGVDEALKLLRTDYIDIVHLHSCPMVILQQGDVVEALNRTRDEGKIKATAYSGENDALEFAIYSTRMDSIQVSVNICDQKSLLTFIPKAKERNMGVIAKRSVANAPWLYLERPVGLYCEDYWVRWQQMKKDYDIGPEELFLRFTAFSEGVDSALIGTTNIDHINRNTDIIRKGKLPDEIIENLIETFKENDENWIGLV